MQSMEQWDQDILTKFNNRSLDKSLKTSAQAGTFLQMKSIEGLPSPKECLSWTHHCPSSITEVGKVDSNRFFKVTIDQVISPRLVLVNALSFVVRRGKDWQYYPQ